MGFICNEEEKCFVFFLLKRDRTNTFKSQAFVLDKLSVWSNSPQLHSSVVFNEWYETHTHTHHLCTQKSSLPKANNTKKPLTLTTCLLSALLSTCSDVMALLLPVSCLLLKAHAFSMTEVCKQQLVNSYELSLPWRYLSDVKMSGGVLQHSVLNLDSSTNPDSELSLTRLSSFDL